MMCFMSGSPADLHGMWFPSVRRTLLCLSKLYRCLDKAIFQGLSQEALTACIANVSLSAQAISTRKVCLFYILLLSTLNISINFCE